MPTLRSKFTVEQFEKVLQKFAHEIPRFNSVSTEDYDLTFYYDDAGKPRKISVQVHKATGKKDRWGNLELEYWSFTIETKLYTTSDDSTKITFAYEGNEEKIRKFIEENMVSEKVMPRFRLSQVSSS